MKNIFFIIILFSFIGFSQTNNLTQLPNLNSISINSAFTLQPVQLNTSKKTFSSHSFSSFNNTTGVKFNYLRRDENYLLSSFNSNLNLFGRNKVDSFNPNGVSNIGSALIMGTLNLFFNN